MADLWKVLHYDEVATKIAGALQLGTGVCLLEGPPGIGKSWLAKDIGAVWDAHGGSAVLAEGDSLKSDASFHPFGFAMGGLPSVWRSVAPKLAGIARAGEALVGTAGLVTTTLEALVQARKHRRRGRPLYLGETEQAILHELERLSRKRPILFIADNLHWWDVSSLGLLKQLTTPRMGEAFPFLSGLRILAVQTPEPYQVVAHPAARGALLKPSTTARFSLQRIPRQSFEDVLVALGATPRPSKEVTDVVYSFSGGHLALASRCANRITKGEAAVFLAASDAEEFVRTLLTERIQSLGTPGEEAVAMLQVAAILGLTFREDEVSCASGRDRSDTVRLLRYCRGEGVLTLEDGLDRFVHDLYRQHFLKLADASKIDIHGRLSDCLRRLRPAEYELRCLNAIEAERRPEASALAMQAALAARREGRNATELPGRVLSVIEEAGGWAIVERFQSAQDHLSGYRFNQCMASLDGLPRNLHNSLAAEADYLRAMCLMSTRSEQDRARGRSILEAWMGYEDEEPELGMRLMLLLLYGLFHVPDKEPGWALERRIHRALAARASFDLAAEDALYTLDRCSGGLHPSDVTLPRTREAAEHFGPHGGQTLLRRPVEYYRCMVNYGATLIGNALYEEAREVYNTVESLIANYPSGVFPRIDYAQLNGLLADYRLGILDANEAVMRQRRIAAYGEVEGDPFYVQNALAVYLSFAGQHQSALEIFDRLDAELNRSRAEPEPSMVYLIRANRCATRFVAGDIGHAQSEWPSLAAIAEQSNYTDRDIVRLRHELLTEVINEGQVMSAIEFDEYLLERHPDQVGPLWKSSALGFMMPAIEFWREN